MGQFEGQHHMGITKLLIPIKLRADWYHFIATDFNEQQGLISVL